MVSLIRPRWPASPSRILHPSRD